MGALGSRRTDAAAFMPDRMDGFKFADADDAVEVGKASLASLHAVPDFADIDEPSDEEAPAPTPV